MPRGLYGTRSSSIDLGHVSRPRKPCLEYRNSRLMNPPPLKYVHFSMPTARSLSGPVLQTRTALPDQNSQPQSTTRTAAAADRGLVWRLFMKLRPLLVCHT